MRSYCAKQGCDFATLLGDNIYPDGATAGADGIDDALRFRDLLMIPYGPLGDGLKDFRIYTVLGNHDWHTSREGAMAQVRFTLASRVGRHGGRTHRDNRRVRKRRNASSASGMSASSGNG
jgi:hypothetical protein